MSPEFATIDPYVVLRRALQLPDHYYVREYPDGSHSVVSNGWTQARYTADDLQFAVFLTQWPGRVLGPEGPPVGQV